MGFISKLKFLNSSKIKDLNKLDSGKGASISNSNVNNLLINRLQQYVSNLLNDTDSCDSDDIV